MFQPSQEDVRRFFCAVYAKSKSDQALQAIEMLASLWIAEHPEHHADLENADQAIHRVYLGDAGGGNASSNSNPFLHLAMHLSISEQCSIDQPKGIRQAVEKLIARCDSLHDAHHQVMECLGQMLWNSQQNGLPFDGQQYIASILRLASRD